MTNDFGVFISYRRTDANWAAIAIESRLERDFAAVKVFLDVSDIEPGEDFTDLLCRRLSECKVLLALIGPNWLTAQDEAGRRRLDSETDWVRLEIAHALQAGMTVIPILIDTARLPSEEHLPQPLKKLAQRQALRLVHFEHHENLTKLVNALRKSFPNLTEEQRVPTPVQPHVQADTLRDVVPVHIVKTLLDKATEDNETLSVLAEDELNSGRFAMACALFEVVSQRLLKHDGPEDIGFVRATYQVGRTKLLMGEFEFAAKMLESMAHRAEYVRDASYPLYHRANLGVARAYLELGNPRAAREFLTCPDGMLFQDQNKNAMLAWIADLEGDHETANRYNVLVDQDMASHPPTPEFTHSLARYRETRNVPEARPTMVWSSIAI
jgi:hypothetical protein